ncbi:MAG: HAD-IA family hydrolase [Rhodobacteraceae bacterium]|nr:HAD-IA family hydrolase [Paracoccaceae bacterium]
MTPGAVLFDCDGVIVDSEEIGFEMLLADFAAAGRAVSAAELRRLFLGGTIPVLEARARAMGVPLPAGWAGDFYERLYARLALGTPLVEGIEAVLDRLDAGGVPYAVGSNGTLRKMEITLGQHPALWRRLRGRLFSGQDLGLVKPDPGLYLHAAAALGVAAADCVVVEDSPTGARAAAGAGMRCLGYAPPGGGGGAALAAEGAQVFAAMAELPALLGL